MVAASPCPPDLLCGWFLTSTFTRNTQKGILRNLVQMSQAKLT